MFTFIESSIFERNLPVYLDDDEYSEFQQFLMQNPEAGELVPGSGGVRKVRWARPGMGKRGAVRTRNIRAILHPLVAQRDGTRSNQCIAEILSG